MSLALFAILSAQAQYNIKIHIKGLPKDSSVILAHYYGKVQYIPKDTAIVDANSSLHFSGKTSLPGGVYLIVFPKGYMEFLITDETHQNFSLDTDLENVVLHMKAKGSEDNHIFYGFQQFMISTGMRADSLQKKMHGSSVKDSLAILEQLRGLDKEANEFKEKFVSTHNGTFACKVIKAAWDPEIPKDFNRRDSTKLFQYYRNHFYDNMDFSDDRMVRTPIYQARLERFMKELTVQTPDSINKAADYVVGKTAGSKEQFKYCVWWITNNYETSSLMGMDAVFVHMARKYYLSGKAYWIDSTTYKKIKERADKLEPLLIGKKAPNIYCTDSLGNYKPLYNVKAKYTILYFWDPNCGHCQKVTPKLYEFYEANKSKGIAVYAVSMDREDGKWKKYINEHKLYNWYNVWDSKTVTDFHNVWDVTTTPQVYILDENKVIIAKKIGVEQLDDYFNNYLLKQPPAPKK